VVDERCGDVKFCQVLVADLFFDRAARRADKNRIALTMPGCQEEGVAFTVGSPKQTPSPIAESFGTGAAIQIFDCSGRLCVSIVWLRKARNTAGTASLR
jgi:hypothetical protein